MEFEYRAFCLLLEIAQTLYLYIGCAPIQSSDATHFFFLVRIPFSSVFFSMGLFNFCHRQTFLCLHKNMRRLKIFVRVCVGNCASTEYLLMPLPAIFINSATPTERRKAFAPYIFAHNIIYLCFGTVSHSLVNERTSFCLFV